MIAFLFAACVSDAPFADTDPATEPRTDPVTEPRTEAVTKAPETEPPETGPVEPYGDFDIVLGEPVVVFQGRENDQGWGRHQFPGIAYTTGGFLRVTWVDGKDEVGAQNTVYRKVSVNGGKSWFEASLSDAPVVHRVPMPNGKYMAGFLSVNYRPEDATGHTPVYSDKEGQLYLVEDLRGDESLADFVTFGIYEYDPETDKTEVVEATLEWPYATVKRHEKGGYLMTLSFQVASNDYTLLSAEDGTLYAAFYAQAPNSAAASLTEALASRMDKPSVFVIASKDSGRTWRVVHQFIPTAEAEAMSVNVETYESPYEGFTEPALIQMDSGRFLILLRTGHTRTMMYSVSEDGESWSDPLPFDICGVYPQLITLDCGVTLASYGRPLLRLRATSDPTGEVWQDPVTVPLTAKSYENDGLEGRTRSCFYTGIVPMDANTAMLVYSDFRYPDKEGYPLRTILVRKVHIVPKTAE